MTRDGNDCERVLAEATLLELAVEVIELGRAGVIEKLRSIEPIPHALLMKIVSVRIGVNVDSREDAIEGILRMDALDESTKLTLALAARSKAIEIKYFSG
ncbi:hypothetical protein ABU614_23115 [Lysobacter firmicutimachus]|uniref:Uncharacterized protein n=1 Tax=Lysobacter firmicutimachus TaxID=1792846 RepID=A0AAU8MT60_9GAMM